MKRIVSLQMDDQVALNTAARELGIVWNGSSDIRYKESTGLGRGTFESAGEHDHD